jgi:tetratricopeptide (TPR) repeat protein
VGKSRLYWEFTRSHRVEGALIVESRSVSYGKATSYLPVIDLLKTYFEIEPRDERRRMREKITGKLLSLDEVLRPCLPALLALLDLPVEDATWQALDAPQRRQRTLDAVKRLLLRESQVQPLVVVFEDLHWIDPETQALLDTLVESVPTARLLLLVNYRPEYQHGWGSKTYYHQLQIEPLPPEDANTLLEGLLGDDATLGPLKALLIPRTGGNPFFLEESVRTLIETGALVGERGSYRLAQQSGGSVQMPSTVHAVLAARIDRLPPEEKRLLQCAAVIGKDVPFALLEAIADVSEPDLRRQLTTLQAGEFIYEVRLFPDLEYMFKHALTHEVVYSSLTNNRRRALDAAIVETIERLAAERLAEHVERLANHAFRGEVWAKAAMYLQRAGERAAERCAYQQVVADLSRALVALEHLPEERETLERFIDIKLELCRYTMTLGDPGAGLVHARDALSSAERLQDNVRVALSCTAMAHILPILGRGLESQPLASRALEAANAADDSRARLGAHMILGVSHWILGNYHEGRGHFETALAMIRNDSLDWTSVPLPLWQVGANSRAWMVLILVELGEFDYALEIAREAAEQAEARQLFYPLARFALPWSYVRRGESRAILELERGLALCREMKHMPMAVPYTAALGAAYTLAGRVAEGIPLLEEAIAKAEVHNRANRSLFRSFLSQAYLLAARPEDAIRVAREGLTGARERHERGEEAWNLRDVAEASAYADAQEADVSERCYVDSMVLADELGMQPLKAHCHSGLAKLYRRSGKRRESDKHLITATLMYREMGMTYWLEKVEREIRELGSHEQRREGD